MGATAGQELEAKQKFFITMQAFPRALDKEFGGSRAKAGRRQEVWEWRIRLPSGETPKKGEN